MKIHKKLFEYFKVYDKIPKKVFKIYNHCIKFLDKVWGKCI
ncbi:MAG: hypothetical protein PWP46_1942 [Fusobacteriaceae bacterium]|jgi:hypothetical protein|nr:hypothetical protein [Fusobacteriales bacterium]MDN5305056.1 hypothetical protein [Fusobacteriaceae bacterium]